jgi:hypothetical protein
LPERRAGRSAMIGNPSRGEAASDPLIASIAD